MLLARRVHPINPASLTAAPAGFPATRVPPSSEPRAATASGGTGSRSARAALTYVSASPRPPDSRTARTAPQPERPRNNSSRSFRPFAFRTETHRSHAHGVRRMSMR